MQLTNSLSKMRYLALITPVLVMGAGHPVLAKERALGHDALVGQSRPDIERALPTLAAKYTSTPTEADVARDYAQGLFKLGNVWRASQVMGPLATPKATDVWDLEFGATIALFLGEYEKAETLYERIGEVAKGNSEAQTRAIEGLVMVYYESNQYGKTKNLKLLGQKSRVPQELLTYMQRFEGQPYQIMWTSPGHVAHLPIINDIAAPGALPLMKLEVNGRSVEFILDTGGDRLYIDEGVAKDLGIKNISSRTSKYAYTKGKYVDEPLGVAERVRMGDVTLSNVPVIVAKWKSLGSKSDGIVTTQILKQFLTTVDYTKKELTFRERGPSGRAQFLETFKASPLIQMPFFMAGTHQMYAKGKLNDHDGLNMLLDSGLGMDLPLVVVDQTADLLKLQKTDLPNSKFYTVPIQSYGLGTLIRGQTSAVGNVFVEEDPYRQSGFFFDALISHQYLRHLAAWTIDFDTQTYYFPAKSDEGPGK